MESVSRFHDFLFKEMGDPRVYDWPIMATPWKMLAILVVYLFLIYVILPAHMAIRQPYDLRKAIVIYNVIQIFANGAIAISMTTLTWASNYTLGCQLMDYSNEAKASGIASIFWWGLMLKIFDLLDTVIFVLRKKYNQVSVFHVYHHTSTVVVVWMLTKYIGGGVSFLGITLNTTVHVFMYTYYLLSTLGPEYQKITYWMKSKITTIQMAHLTILAFHTGQTLLPSCKFSSLLGFIMVPDLLINLYFFYDFWLKTYTKKRRSN